MVRAGSHFPHSGKRVTQGFQLRAIGGIRARSRFVFSIPTYTSVSAGSACASIHSQVTADQATSIHLPAYPPTADPSALRRLIRLMRTQGLLSKDIDPAPLLVK